MAGQRFRCRFGNLLAAIVFFAMAILVASYDRTTVDLKRLMPYDFLSIPLLGITIGAGIGVLWERIGTGVLVGLGITVPFLAAMELIGLVQRGLP